MISDTTVNTLLGEKRISEIDIAMMRRALELASEGVGQVSPNPLVGCVIVSAAGDIVGEGSYRYDNIDHAEVIALKQAGPDAKGGTAYVSLEPHSHQGRTPPCTAALINAGIQRVVAPIDDPNPAVSGRGFEELRKNGIEVITGVLAREARQLNEKFFVWHEKQRPFVHLKLASSLDGRISLSHSVSTAISDAAALKRVHEIRHEHDAILVGANTVVVDDPSLTDRSGNPRRRKLVRVILDNRLRISPEAKLARTSKDIPTIVFSNSLDADSIGPLSRSGVDVISGDARDLQIVLQQLRARDIQSVLVEGGTQIAGAFCDAGFVDKVTFMIAPLIIGGLEAPPSIGGRGAANLADALKLSDVSVSRHGPDIEITGYPLPR